MIVNATAYLALELRAKTRRKKKDGFMMGRGWNVGSKTLCFEFSRFQSHGNAFRVPGLFSSSFVHVGLLILVLNLCFAETPGVMDEDMLGTCGAVDFGGWQVGRRDELWNEMENEKRGEMGVELLFVLLETTQVGEGGLDESGLKL